MHSSNDSSVADPELIERFQTILTGSWQAQALHVAASLRIADLLAGGPRTSADLAAATSTNEPALRRLLRALGTIQICEELEDGRFALAPLGSLLQENSPLTQRAWTIWWGRHLWPLWGNLLHSVTTGESARKLLSGTEGFAHLEQDPEAAATFNRAGTDHLRLSAESIVRTYDFGSLMRIVDVGGGHGDLLLTILKANPSASGVLFDLAHAIDGARHRVDICGMTDRCELVVGDFFQSVPGGADAYILKSIVHDWNDERSRRILATCRAAMISTARLLICESILPERFGTSPEDQAIARSDLTMLVAHGAQERTEEQYRRLLASAGLRVSRILPVLPRLAIIEAFPTV